MLPFFDWNNAITGQSPVCKDRVKAVGVAKLTEQ